MLWPIFLTFSNIYVLHKCVLKKKVAKNETPIFKYIYICVSSSNSLNDTSTAEWHLLHQSHTEYLTDTILFPHWITLQWKLKRQLSSGFSHCFSPCNHQTKPALSDPLFPFASGCNAYGASEGERESEGEEREWGRETLLWVTSPIPWRHIDVPAYHPLYVEAEPNKCSVWLSPLRQST